MSRCGWGILGTGKIARIMACALRDSQAGWLVAVASRSAGRAAGFASQFGISRHYPDYASLIGDPDVDIVYVATHHPDHREWAVAAAEARKHVLCEKPLAVTADGAAEIIEAARRSGVFLMEAFAYRCHPQTSRLVETGCYATSMAHLIVAAGSGTAPVVSLDVAGIAHFGEKTGVDHYAAAVLAFPGGIVARVASAIQVNLDSSLRIYGSAGTITVPSPWLPGRDGAPSAIIIDRAGAAREEIRIDPGADLYVLEADAVSHLVREGKRAHPLMQWDESLANLRTMDSWRDSVGLAYEADDRRAGNGRGSEARGGAGGP